MKDIFANLYNKVVSFFHQTDNETSNAKDVACNRLKLVLMQDRTNLTPAIMDRMRKELIELLSKYVELDKELLDLNFEHEDNQMALMLSIPVIRAKNEEEIQEMIDKEEEEKKPSKAVIIFAVIGAVVAIAAAVYGIYRFFTTDYLDDF